MIIKFDFLQKQYQREVKLLRSVLKSILPKDVIANRALFSALEVILTFATWRRLREDQKLSVKQAKEAVTFVITKLTTDIET